MNGAIEIRHAARDDLLNIAAFFDDCWRSAYRRIISDEYLNALSASKRHKGYLARYDEGASEFLMMYDGDDLIGASVFGKSFTEGYPDDGELSAIYLRHDCIGKGLGHTLFEKAEQRLAERGYSYFVLDVLAANTRAVSFYEKHGFIKVDERSITIGADDYPLLVFRKKAQ